MHTLRHTGIAGLGKPDFRRRPSETEPGFRNKPSLSECAEKAQAQAWMNGKTITYPEITVSPYGRLVGNRRLRPHKPSQAVRNDCLIVNLGNMACAPSGAEIMQSVMRSQVKYSGFVAG